MNKTDIIEKVAESTGVTKKTAAEIINATFDQIEDALAQGESRVSISGFGSFTANIVPPKEMRSPLNNGGVISVDKTSKVRFHASDKFKDRITKAGKAATLNRKTK